MQFEQFDERIPDGYFVDQVVEEGGDGEMEERNRLEGDGSKDERRRLSNQTLLVALPDGELVIGTNCVDSRENINS